MAFLQRKRTLRLSPSTCHLLLTQPGLCNPAAQRHAPKLSQRTPHGPERPQHVAPEGADQATGKASQGARGLPAARPREPRGAAPPLPEPHEPPDGRAALPGPAPGPGPLLPRGAAGREEGNPAGRPPPAPGAPAAIGPRAGGNRVHPHAAVPPGAPLPVLSRIAAAPAGKRRPRPGHPPRSAPAGKRGSSRESSADRGPGRRCPAHRG